MVTSYLPIDCKHRAVQLKAEGKKKQQNGPFFPGILFDKLSLGFKLSLLLIIAKIMTAVRFLSFYSKHCA